MKTKTEKQPKSSPRRNHYLFILIAIIIFISLEIGFTWFFLFQRNKLHQTEITLNVRTYHYADNSEITKLSDDSLEELRKIISDETVNKLVEDFDKERSFYINFITIISIFLTMVGVISAVYGFFEKSENVRLHEELDILKNEYDSQLEDIKIQNVMMELKYLSDMLNDNATLIIKGKNKKVGNLEDLERYILLKIETIIKKCNTDLLCNKFLDKFSIFIFNLMLSISKFSEESLGKRLFAGTNNSIIIIKTSILKTLLIKIETIVCKENYDKLINQMKSFPDKRFDFTDL